MATPETTPQTSTSPTTDSTQLNAYVAGIGYNAEGVAPSECLRRREGVDGEYVYANLPCALEAEYPWLVTPTSINLTGCNLSFPSGVPIYYSSPTHAVDWSRTRWSAQPVEFGMPQIVLQEPELPGSFWSEVIFDASATFNNPTMPESRWSDVRFRQASSFSGGDLTGSRFDRVSVDYSLGAYYPSGLSFNQTIMSGTQIDTVSSDYSDSVYLVLQGTRGPVTVSGLLIRPI